MKKNILAIFLSSIFALHLHALDTKFSGYLNMSYNITDKPYTYKDFISNDGTFRNDTNLGLQIETNLNDKFSLKAQTKYAQSLNDDNDFDLTLNWGFLNYAHSDDLSISLGKIRVPYYLNSQNEDVGVTYDFAKLPEEVYTLSPYDNGIGAIVSKQFFMENGYLNLDVFHYEMDLEGRSYEPESGVSYFDYELDITGFSLGFTSDELDKYRFGYYKTDLLGLDIDIYTAGLAHSLNDDYEIKSEITYSYSTFLNSNFETKAGYIALFRNFDEFVAYGKYGLSIPSDEKRGYESYSLGGSYLLDLNQKIKFEYNHIKTKSEPSNLIDFETANAYSNENINLFTITYNLAF